jgi:septal ring factor EnvC (AmiA/AmiB activator)
VSTERRDSEPQHRADELQREADSLERHGDEVEEHIASARDQWERKRSDDAVPGAQPPLEDETDFEENPADQRGGPMGGRES